ncbi:pilus assembly protein PilM [Comamonadaceae bacterium PP-2]
MPSFISARVRAYAASRLRLGIDVGASGLRLVALAHDRNQGWTVVHCAHAALLARPSTALPDEDSDEHAADAAGALRRVLAAIGCGARQAVLALPWARIQLLRLERPAGLAGGALAAHLLAQARARLDYPLDLACTDFDERAVSRPEAADLWLVAARRALLMDRIALAAAAGLDAVAVDGDVFAACRAAERVSRDPQLWIDAAASGSVSSPAPAPAPAPAPVPVPSVLVDLGWRAIRLLPLAEAEWGRSGSQALHGPAWLERLAQAGHCTTDEVALRIEAGDWRSAETVAGRQVVHDLAAAIAALLAASAVPSGGAVWLSGAAAALPLLPSAVEAATGCRCRVLDPFAGMTVAAQAGLSRVPGASAAYAVACGLALHGTRGA